MLNQAAQKFIFTLEKITMGLGARPLYSPPMDPPWSSVALCVRFRSCQWASYNRSCDVTSHTHELNDKRDDRLTDVELMDDADPGSVNTPAGRPAIERTAWTGKVNLTARRHDSDLAQ